MRQNNMLPLSTKKKLYPSAFDFRLLRKQHVFAFITENSTTVKFQIVK